MVPGVLQGMRVSRTSSLTVSSLQKLYLWRKMNAVIGAVEPWLMLIYTQKAQSGHRTMASTSHWGTGCKGFQYEGSRTRCVIALDWPLYVTGHWAPGAVALPSFILTVTTEDWFTDGHSLFFSHSWDQTECHRNCNTLSS
jgi:hypothetical protein